MAHKSHNKVCRKLVADRNEKARALLTDPQQIEVLETERPGKAVREITRLTLKETARRTNPNGGA